MAVRCQVRTVSLEGLSDGRSIKAILAQVSPHKLVLVNGDEASTSHLLEHCKAAFGQDEVFAPVDGDMIDGSSHSSAYTVKLSDGMLAGLNPRKIGGYEIARVSGVLDIPNGNGSGEGGSTSAGPPLRAGVSGVLEPRRERRSGSVDFVSEGEVRLADLKQLLTRAGHHAEFSSGALIINSTVRVRKDGQGQRLLLEGAYGEDYLRVRSLLFEQMEGT